MSTKTRKTIRNPLDVISAPTAEDIAKAEAIGQELKKQASGIRKTVAPKPELNAKGRQIAANKSYQKLQAKGKKSKAVAVKGKAKVLPTESSITLVIPEKVMANGSRTLKNQKTARAFLRKNNLNVRQFDKDGQTWTFVREAKVTGKANTQARKAERNAKTAETK